MGIYDFTARTIEGEDRGLDAYAGQVLLIVNVASRCGFTPQYTGLEALHRRYPDGPEQLRDGRLAVAPDSAKVVAMRTPKRDTAA